MGQGSAGRVQPSWSHSPLATASALMKPPRRLTLLAALCYVRHDKGRVERIPYELCVLVALRDAMRRREIWVVGANRWRNPEDDLPADFEDNRDVHYAALGKRKGPTPSVASIYRVLAEHAKREAYPEVVEQAHTDFTALQAAGELPSPHTATQAEANR